VLAALQLAGRAVGALRAAAGSDVAAQASDLQALAQALEIALQKLGLGDPTRLPAALDPMFTFDVTLVAAITVSAPDEQDAREKITGALATSRAILGNWPDGAPILSTAVHTDDGDGTSGLATWSRGRRSRWPELPPRSRPMSDIFGYAWSDIQRAQQGGRLGRAVDTSVPVSSAPTEEDRALLAQHGGSLDALEAAGMYGAADRLRRHS
jgi:type II secretory pathway pseudopilin PulG